MRVFLWVYMVLWLTIAAIMRTVNGNFKERFVRKVMSELAKGIKIRCGEEIGFPHIESIEYNDNRLFGRQILIVFKINPEKQLLDSGLLVDSCLNKNLKCFGIDGLECSPFHEELRVFRSDDVAKNGRAYDYWSRASYAFTFDDTCSIDYSVRELRKWCTRNLAAPQII